MHSGSLKSLGRRFQIRPPRRRREGGNLGLAKLKAIGLSVLTTRPNRTDLFLRVIATMSSGCKQSLPTALTTCSQGRVKPDLLAELLAEDEDEETPPEAAADDAEDDETEGMIDGRICGRIKGNLGRSMFRSNPLYRPDPTAELLEEADALLEDENASLTGAKVDLNFDIKRYGKPAIRFGMTSEVLEEDADEDEEELVTVFSTTSGRSMGCSGRITEGLTSTTSFTIASETVAADDEEDADKEEATLAEAAAVLSMGLETIGYEGEIGCISDA